MVFFDKKIFLSLLHDINDQNTMYVFASKGAYVAHLNINC